jgi:2-keto-4-pentenoate hydratase
MKLADPVFQPQAFAGLLAESRARGIPMRVQEAGALPPDLGAAMQVQGELARLLGEQVSGWKVAVGPGGTAVAAPLLRGSVHASGAAVPLLRDGTARIEVELALRLSRDVPGEVRLEELGEFVSEILVGIEVLETRYAGEAPFPVFMADNLGNGGYVIGSGVPFSGDRISKNLCCTVKVDGSIVFDSACAHPNQDPLTPFFAAAAAPPRVLGGLKRGQIVTTGNLCGVIPISGPAQISAEVGGIGKVDCWFI